MTNTSAPRWSSARLERGISVCASLGLAGRRQPTVLLERAPKNEFDLRVQAAQIVVRPALHGLQQRRVHAQQKRLPLRQPGYW